MCFLYYVMCMNNSVYITILLWKIMSANSFLIKVLFDCTFARFNRCVLLINEMDIYVVYATSVLDKLKEEQRTRQVLSSMATQWHCCKIKRESRKKSNEKKQPSVARRRRRSIRSNKTLFVFVWCRLSRRDIAKTVTRSFAFFVAAMFGCRPRVAQRHPRLTIAISCANN